MKRIVCPICNGFKASLWGGGQGILGFHCSKRVHGKKCDTDFVVFLHNLEVVIGCVLQEKHQPPDKLVHQLKGGCLVRPNGNGVVALT